MENKLKHAEYLNEGAAMPLKYQDQLIEKIISNHAVRVNFLVTKPMP